MLGIRVGRRLKRWRCRHENVRCVHGDEINDRNTRCICTDCGKALRDRGLSEPCTVTGKPHASRHPSRPETD